MQWIRKNAFWLCYVGAILFIVATITPLIKFNNQSFAFIDQYFYLSFFIAILATIIMIFTTVRLYRATLIPTIIASGIVIYGIYQIFQIENFKMINPSFGIAIILYPLAFITLMIGGILSPNGNQKKQSNKIKNNIASNNTQDIDNSYTNYSPNTTNTILVPNTDNFSSEQIPLEKILKKESTNEIQNDINSPTVQEIQNTNDSINTNNNSIIDNLSQVHELEDQLIQDISQHTNQNTTKPENIDIQNNNPFTEILNQNINNIPNNNLLQNESNQKDNQNYIENKQNDIINTHDIIEDIFDEIPNNNLLQNELNQEEQQNYIENKQNDIINTHDIIEDIFGEIPNNNLLQNESNQEDNQNYIENKQNDIINTNDIFDDNNIPNIKMSNLNNELDNIIDNKNLNGTNDEELSLKDIIEEKNLKDEYSKNINQDFEIPDITTNNSLMTNNTQVEEKPKQEFMAFNPSDIKTEEKKSLFKKKEKVEQVEKVIDPLEKIMNRNIPQTLGRTCQFCNTPLGDDERICPLCGRIN